VALAVLGLAGGCVQQEAPDAGTTPESPAIIRWGGDLLGAGETVAISETVQGDVVLAGGTLRFLGTADGSYLGAGGEQEIGGRVASSVRAAGGTIRLRSTVGRNVTAAGGEIHLEEGTVVGRNAYLAGGTIDVAGAIEGSLRVAGGEVLLDGPIEGDVVVDAAQLTVGPRARISGNLDYRVGGGAFTLDPAAEVEGVVTALPPRGEREGGGTLFRALRVLAFLLAGGVVVMLFPRATSAASEVLRNRTLASFGFGFLWILLVPLGIAVVAVTVIGIPLALMSAPLFVASLYLAPIPAAVWLGARLLTGTRSGLRRARLTQFLVGGFLVATLGFVPVVGLLFKAAVTVLGVGAGVLAFHSAAFPAEASPASA
jgi:hypothetical protein